MMCEPISRWTGSWPPTVTAQEVAERMAQRAKIAIDSLPKAGLADLGGTETGGVENWLIVQTVYREASELFK